MKGKALLFFVPPLLAWLTVQLFVHARVSDFMALIADQLNPVAMLHYEGVTAGLDGRIGLLDVTIKPRGVDDELRMAELSLKLPDIWYLLELQQRLEQQVFPDSLSLRVSELAFSTRGELAERLEASMFAEDASALASARSSCVGRSSLPTQVHLLDYDAIRADAELGYRFDAVRGEIVLYARGEQADAVALHGEVAMVMDGMDTFGLMRTARNPKVVRASLELSDEGYFDRVFEHCRSEKIARRAVADALAKNVVALFDGLPLRPDAPLIAAYERFVTRGTRLTVTAAPAQPQNLAQLSLFDPTAVPALLNVRTRVN